MSLNDSAFIQYSRQIMLPEVGELGQQRLMEASVAIVGLGGLGQLCAQYLSAAGIGRMTLIDDDKVELSNLPRQLLFSHDDCGQYKVELARDRLVEKGSAQNSPLSAQVQISAKVVRLDGDNAESLLSGVDLVLDCSDNFATRQHINAACVALSTPNVVAAAAHFAGQLMAFDLSKSPDSGCYHCLFPAELRVSESCSTIGILGPMVGTMASMQALLAIKLFLGLPGLGLLHRFDGLTGEMRKFTLRRDPKCSVCAAIKELNEEVYATHDETTCSSALGEIDE
ncbi:HesA/MoeB/ThiF family protein [Shewanella alkalitolerans]|uniref:HesA/MoeB/ThiF family protein n=1 Tax=Shewanella alkalitolerans TaxID=2864209 RepID=UPI001C655840|nr:HesA/MoeB/ThiF family protein [Shewanella alkalitolerans]QYJ96046.1 HesA/MoeB/ThiF family protein [Shewanella alkalitolerans]